LQVNTAFEKSSAGPVLQAGTPTLWNESAHYIMQTD